MPDKIQATQDIWHHDLYPVTYGLEKATIAEMRAQGKVDERDFVVIPVGSQGTRIPGTTLTTFTVRDKNNTLVQAGCHPPHYCIEVIGRT